MNLSRNIPKIVVVTYVTQVITKALRKKIEYQSRVL